MTSEDTAVRRATSVRFCLLVSFQIQSRCEALLLLGAFDFKPPLQPSHDDVG